MSLIGITMGCPVGIGPEIILKFFKTLNSQPNTSAVVIGDIDVLQQNAKHFNIDISCHIWHPGDPILENGIPVYNVSKLKQKHMVWGAPNKNTGQAMAKYIEKAVELASKGFIDGIATCPISKIALQKAGYSFPGHTEMLANLTGKDRFTMMMAGDKLKVTLVTIHCALKNVPEVLTTQSILERIELTASSLMYDFGINNPKIAVAGLNPHSGEDGMFGHEESGIILPAIQQAVENGINALGPIPPDTVFVKAAAGMYDGVVCMYHDQGLIPFKLLHFNDGVNVTIGLPLVRTSVDHGTAYDIAGKGIAAAESLAAAVKLAEFISENRKKNLMHTFS